MGLELLKEADYVLDACGRSIPPAGFKFVDLPRIIPYRSSTSVGEGVPGGQPAAGRLSNNSNTLFLVRGIVLDSSGPNVRIKWPNGRYWNQNPGQISAGGFPNGSGGNMIALNQEQPIERGARITIEQSGGGGDLNIQFWGVLRYLLKDTGGPWGAVPVELPGVSRGDGCIIGYPAEAAGKPPTCLIGYPLGARPGAGGDRGGPALRMIENPIATYAGRPRIACGPNQNIMAPELLLGNQCGPDVPASDEAFTFFSDPITVALNQQSFNNAVIVPGDADVVIKRFRTLNVWAGEEAGGATPIAALRLPNGYSVTGGDMVPVSGLWWIPIFPPMRVEAGGRLILDVANFGGAGAGSITSVFEFDAVKRRAI